MTVGELNKLVADAKGRPAPPPAAPAPAAGPAPVNALAQETLDRASAAQRAAQRLQAKADATRQAAAAPRRSYDGARALYAA
jgi:hypothetical protein